MKRTGWLLAALSLTASLFLGACVARTPVSPTPETPTAVPTEEAAPTLPTLQPSEVPTGPVTIVTPETPGTCITSTLNMRPVDETDWVRGASAEEAEVTIVEYSDFQCPGCSGVEPVIDELVQKHPEVRLVYRHFPLVTIHDKAFLAAEAAEAAGAQGMFWEMHKKLFANQQSWSGLASEEEFRKTLTTYAEELGLDVEKFDADLTNHTYADKVQASYDEASEQLQLPGTPSFIFNGISYQMDLSYESLEKFLTISQQLQSMRYSEPPTMTLDTTKEYQAIFHTSKGDVVVDLFPTAAPTHINNFIFLTKEKWFDGTKFFFVQTGYVAVGGDPTNTGTGDPGYYCTGEIESSNFDRPGLMGITPSGQYFFTLGIDAAQLSGRLPLIGQVSEGLDVLQALTPRQPDAGEDAPADVVESIEIIEK